LVRHYFDLLNTNDLSGLEEILSPDVVFFGPRAPEGIYGREAFIEFIVALGRELPDLRFAEGEMVAEGSRVASVFTMRSTHTSEEGAAKMIATEGMDLFHIADGRIQQINAYLDRLSSLVEMGSNLATGSDITSGLTHIVMAPPQQATFLELRHGEVRRILIPRTRVN
jgi:ketosteroid isomerase-like protein